MECADGGVARVLGRGLTADGQLVVLILNISSFNNGVAYTMQYFLGIRLVLQRIMHYLYSREFPI